ncbi:hypothetical protein [Kutzneria chonburiensis]|uniref:DUF5668 domain-containing protein n=1 Tax=Kutzneria chonburiensis TaxID=1483604 RepID=A0ABV6MLN2_9PSEU|nr:hypothetical protein [Kutzneria chonburiensis]
MSSDPSPQQRAVVHPQPPRERRARVWLGGLLLLSGGFFFGDTLHRLDTVWVMLAQWWPWALIVLAVVNLARSFLRVESLLAPGLLVLVAVVFLAVRQGIEAGMVINFAVPLVAILGGLTLLVSVGSAAGRSWTRILVTGRVEAVGPVTRTLRPRAVLGEVRVDLRGCPGRADGGPIVVHPTVLFGHVRLDVPKHWVLTMKRDGALLTQIRDPGTNPSEADRTVELEIFALGFAGVISVARGD